MGPVQIALVFPYQSCWSHDCGIEQRSNFGAEDQPFNLWSPSHYPDRLVGISIRVTGQWISVTDIFRLVRSMHPHDTHVDIAQFRYDVILQAGSGKALQPLLS